MNNMIPHWDLGEVAYIEVVSYLGRKSNNNKKKMSQGVFQNPGDQQSTSH